MSNKQNQKKNNNTTKNQNQIYRNDNLDAPISPYISNNSPTSRQNYFQNNQES